MSAYINGVAIWNILPHSYKHLYYIVKIFGGKKVWQNSVFETLAKFFLANPRLACIFVDDSSELLNPLTRKGQYTGHFTQCTENAKASILAATTHNQTNSHSFNLVRPRIKVFKYYYSPLNSV